jgi:(S)-ureidoglycine aminohydrolase
MNSGLFDFWLRFGSVTGLFKPAPSPKPRQKPKIPAAHRYIFSVNALSHRICRISSHLHPMVTVVQRTHVKNIQLFLVLLAATVCARAQVTNQIVSDDYAWKSALATETWTGFKRDIVKGVATDFASMEIRAFTLDKGMDFGTNAEGFLEEMIVVKDGNLKITINGKAKTVGRGSVAIVMPGDERSYANAADSGTTFYVLRYHSKKPADVERGKKAGGSFVMDWNEVKYTARDDGAGGTRQFFNRATVMGQRMDLHATLLNPGQSSHAPHHHRAEEMIIMLEGDVEEYLGPAEKDGKSKKATAGDIIYLVSDEYHAIQNIGTKPALYFAFQFE